MVGVGVFCTVRAGLAVGVVRVSGGPCVGFFAAVVRCVAGCAKTESERNPTTSTMSVLIRATLRMGNLLGVVRPCTGVPAPFVLVRAVWGFTAASGPDCWNGRT